jgi:DNA modification methylase
MQIEIPFDIERRTDYTFKYNSHFGRHGWLRLTPAYSVKLVKEIIKSDCSEGANILDPFSGTATTGLVASELGFSSTLFEINPFLIWYGNTKCYKFSVEGLNSLKVEFNNCIESVILSDSFWTPPIHNIERWWHPETLLALASIRNRIVDSFGEPDGNHYSNLVWIAFSRLIIEASSAAFNHVSMSFKEHSVQYELGHIKLLFIAIFSHIISTAKFQLKGDSKILMGDSRDLSFSEKGIFDTVITSPPYPNRISYIRELRPYMYWVKFLNNGADAGALDWEAIGGTWGTATSNLKNWKPTNFNLPERLYEVCNKIDKSGDKNSGLMSNYVHKYFDDMYLHLQNIGGLLKPDAKLNYIVGNSSFYGYFVDTEKILAESMKQLGYQNIKIRMIRKRNSKKGLFEFLVKSS